MSAARRLKVFVPEPEVVPKPKTRGKSFGERHRLFLLALHDAGENGLTDFELAGMLNVDKNNACWRRVELVYLGLAQDTKSKRASPRGRKVSVWRITSRGSKKAQSLLKEEQSHE